MFPYNDRSEATCLTIFLGWIETVGTIGVYQPQPDSPPHE